MDARTGLAVGCVALVAVAAGDWARAAGSQGGTLAHAQVLEQARAAAKKLLVVQYQAYTTVEGPTVAWADPGKQTAAFSALETPTRYRVVSGFRMAALVPQGRIPNAKAKASFEVSQVVGLGIAAQVGVCDPSCANPTHPKGLVFTSGTKPFTLTTDSFTLEPKREYVILAMIHADAWNVSGQVAGAVVRITDIKWEF